MNVCMFVYVGVYATDGGDSEGFFYRSDLQRKRETK